MPGVLSSDLDFALRRFPQIGGLREPPQPVAGGFSGAGVWRVRAAAGDFCLRQWPEGPPERLAGLHRLLAHLRAEGLHEVAVPLRADDGATLVHCGGRLWQLEPWMPGVADFHARPTPARLTNVMQSLARWHRAARRFAPVRPELPWFAQYNQGVPPAVSNRLHVLRQWTPRRLAALDRAIDGTSDSELRSLGAAVAGSFRRLSREIASQLEWALERPVPLQPCLRDVWHDHVLFEGDEVSGLIDPAAARTDTVAADLARLLGSLLGSDYAAHDRALDEYARHAPLSPDERQLVPLLDRSGVLLSGMTWLDRAFLEGRLLSERMQHRVRVLAQRLEAM